MVLKSPFTSLCNRILSRDEPEEQFFFFNLKQWRSFALDSNFWRWSYHFVKNCNKESNEQNEKNLSSLASYSLQCFQAYFVCLFSSGFSRLLKDNPKLDFKMNAKGLLTLETAQEMERLRHSAPLFASRGWHMKPLSLEECIRMEPRIHDLAKEYAGGIYTEGWNLMHCY